MVKTLSEFIAYFRQVADEHVDLQGSFVHGAAGRIIAGTRSQNTYPLLWLETPTLSLLDKDGTSPYGQRHAAFVVLHSASPTDYADQDAKWASTEALALDVLSRLRRDKKARLIGFELDGRQLEAVATLTVDNEIGWRCEFDLGDYVPLPFDASRWQTI
ncbi:MAG: hypothetical protein ACRYFX_05650 [Janthinobacterium lividum]